MIKKAIPVLIALLVFFPPIGRLYAQQYCEERVFIGYPDSASCYVPYRGEIHLPVWIDPVNFVDCLINVRSLNYAVSDRFGGEFLYPWNYEFGQPQYFSDYTEQSLMFTAQDCPDTLFQVASFTMSMNLDEGYIGDTLDVISVASAILTDSLGMYICEMRSYASPLLITNSSSIDEQDLMPGLVTLLGAYPNPFNSSTTLRFSLAEPSDVNLIIYDITGREVKSFYMPFQEPGERSLIWDGTDNKKRPLPSGTYLYAVCGVNIKAFSKITLLN